MKNKQRLLRAVLCLLPACMTDESVEVADQAVVTHGTVQPGGAGGVVVPDDVHPYDYGYWADCDGDGYNDCFIHEIQYGPIGGFSTAIVYPDPVTGKPVTEVICNGDYDGDDPGDASDDEPCNAPLCDNTGPNPPPDVNFPPDNGGWCDLTGAVGEVCVTPNGWGETCDCIYTDPETGGPDWPGGGYPDDTDGDGVNDCPPAP